MKKIPKFLTVSVVVVVVLIITLVIGSAVSDYFVLGELSSKKQAQRDSDVVAEFNGVKITKADVEIETEVNKLMYIAEEKSESDVLKDLLLKEICLVEAEKLELLATSEEVAEFVASQKMMYEEYEEATVAIDEYCQGAGLTLEEYWTALEERAPRIIARNEVYNKFSDEYKEEHGIEKYTALTEKVYEELSAAKQAYKEKLFSEYEKQIVYYD